MLNEGLLLYACTRLKFYKANFGQSYSQSHLGFDLMCCFCTTAFCKCLFIVQSLKMAKW